MLEHLLALLHSEGTVTFSVRVRPGAPKSQVTGVMDDESLKVDVAAAPEGGKANEELIAFFAKAFDVARNQVSIIGGLATRRKIVRIEK